MPRPSSNDFGFVLIVVLISFVLIALYVINDFDNKPLESEGSPQTGSVFSPREIARPEARIISVSRSSIREKPKSKSQPKPEPIKKESQPETSSVSLPALLNTIRSEESGGNYQAYNPSGCEGYGCGGAYQLHAKYASGWAANAGYPGMSSNAATWPAEIQDKTALWMYNQPNGAYFYWCKWTSYC